jgi:hypothetical protein
VGLRDAIKKRVGRVMAKVSGEYSAEAPEAITPFARNLGEDPSRKVVRARLERPKGQAPADDGSDAAS